MRTARHGRERGAAAVEFALVLPLLLMLVVGIVDLGQVFNAEIVMDDAAKEAVRSLTLSGSTSQAVSVGTSSTDYPLNWGQGSAASPETCDTARQSCFTPCPNSNPGNAVAEVVLKADVHYWIPSYLPGIGDFVTIAGKATMPCP
jgi:hypothetical protein